MNQPPTDASRRRFRSFLGATAAVLVIVFLVAGLRSYRDLAVQRARESALENGISAADERIDALREEIELLRSDPATLERVAREDLGMVRSGDIVVKLIPPASSPGSAPEAPDSGMDAPGSGPDS